MAETVLSVYVIGIFCVVTMLSVWISWEVTYYNEIEEKYKSFIDSSLSSVAPSLAVPTYIIYILAIISLILIILQNNSYEDGRAKTMTHVYSAILLMSCVQILTYIWHNIFTFLDIFPDEDTCACTNETIGYLDENNLDKQLLQCYCYVPDLEEAVQILYPAFDGRKVYHLEYNLRVMINALTVKGNSSTNKTEYLAGMDINPAVNIVNDSEAIQKLDVEEILKNVNVNGAFMFLLLSFWMYGLLMVMNQIRMLVSSRTTITLNTFRDVQNDTVSMFIIGIDNLSITVDILDDIAIFAKDTNKIFIPMVLLTIILVGVFITGIFMFYINTDPKYPSVIIFKKITQSIIILLTVINRVYVFWIINNLTTSDPLPLSYWIFFFIELYNFYIAWVTFLLKRKYPDQFDD